MGDRKVERFETGNPGLDRILQGGLLKHGMHVVAGAPGTGKTVLTQQIGFQIASRGHQVVTVTALAESHERLLSHLASFPFFDSRLVGSKAYYLSASRLFIEQGLLPSLHELRQLISSPRADVLIFEGLSAVGNLAASKIDFRRFLFELNTHLTLMSCTGIFIADFDMAETMDGPAFALADTLIVLHRREQAQRHIRELEIIKSRGIDTILGRHTFEIGEQGVMVYPRLESVEGRAAAAPAEKTIRSVGVPRIDQILSGGVRSGSLTMLLGSPGTGKSLLGTHFILEGARQGEPGLIWSFHQPTEEMLDQAAWIGDDLRRFRQEGLVMVEWRPPLELLIDKEFYLLLQLVESRGIQRLLIDPFNPFNQLAAESGRSFDILTALSNTLRARGVTTMVALELDELLGVRSSVQNVPPFGAADCKLLMRFEQRGNRLVRTLVATKNRKGAHDLTIHEYSIGEQGFLFS